MTLWMNVRETLMNKVPVSRASLFEAMQTRALGPLLIAGEAERDGARVEWLSRYMFVARVDDLDILFHDSRSLDTTVAATFAGRKDLTRRLLERAGVQVAPGGVAKSLAQVKAWQQRLETPLVIKPRTGTKGYGISVGVQTPGELKRAYRRANRAGGGVLVERQMAGAEYRVLVVGGEVVGALGKDAAHVVGDGRSTIAELIEVKNALRARNPHLATRLIKVRKHVRTNLERQQLSVESVLPAGQKVYLRHEANFSAGGETLDVTDDLPAAVKAVTVAAVAAIPGLELAGVDIMVDPAVSDPARAVCVLEINTNPGIGGHHFPAVGKPRNVARAIWQHTRAMMAARQAWRHGRPVR
jgi:D-alanine-D-alanine ligase-like ATP-grasp enzyme